MFEQLSRIVQTYFSKVKKGKQIRGGKDKVYANFITQLMSLTTQQKLDNMLDLHSINVSRQAIRHLPSRFYSKWREYRM